MADLRKVEILSVQILDTRRDKLSFRTARFRVAFKITTAGGRVKTTTREGGATRVCGVVPADQKGSATARLDRVFSNYLYSGRSPRAAFWEASNE